MWIIDTDGERVVGRDRWRTGGAYAPQKITFRRRRPLADSCLLWPDLEWQKDSEKIGLAIYLFQCLLSWWIQVVHWKLSNLKAKYRIRKVFEDGWRGGQHLWHRSNSCFFDTCLERCLENTSWQWLFSSLSSFPSNSFPLLIILIMILPFVSAQTVNMPHGK